MANSKSEQHTIPLNDPDLNMSRYDSDVVNWVGFNDRNSPYLSGECLPLYTKTINNTNSWVSPTMDVYTITDNVLYKNGSLLQGFTSGLDWEEFSPTFTYEGQTYTGTVLGGFKSIYGIYYNYKIYIYKENAGIVAVSDVSNYEEAATWFCVAHPQTYNSADLYAWFSGPYPTVSLIPYHVLSGTGSALTPNTDRIRYVLKSDSAISMKDGYENRVVTTISKLKSGTRNERYEGSQVYPSVNSNVQGIVFHAGPHTLYPKIFSAPADLNNNTIPYTSWQTRYVFLNTTNSISSTVLDPTANCMAMEGYFIHRGDSTGSSAKTSPIQLNSVNAYFYWNSGGILGSHYSYLGTSAVSGYSDLYASSNGSAIFTENDAVASRHFAIAPIRGKEDTTSITGNYSWIACTEGRYSTDIGHVDGIGQFGQEVHKNMTISTGFYLSLRLLYIGGNLSTCSIGENDYRGSLLMPWNSIKDAFLDEQSICIQKRSDNKWYYLTLSFPITFNVYKNRYMIFNVPNFRNCLDTETGKWYHVADDWNNRLTWGQSSSPSTANIYWLASGVGSMYSATDYPFPGYQPGALQHKVLSTYPNVIIPSNLSYGTLFTTIPAQRDDLTTTTLDIYKSTAITAGDENSSDTVPTYKISVSDTLQVLDYTGILWTTDNSNILLNPPLFTKYKEGIITIAQMGDISAPLITEDMTEAAIYYGLAQTEGLPIIFCIQSMFYEISDGFLYAIDMIDGVISNPKKIIDLTGLMFIANNQVAAYFWGSNNKTIYMFTGDAVLKPMKGCSKISTVYNTYYKTDTQEIFMMTDVGTYVSTNEYMYRVPGVWKSAFALNYGYGLRSNTGLKLISYYNDAYHNTLEPAVLETRLYGAGNNIVANTDCIYLRFYRGDLGNDPAIVKITGYTLTDMASPLNSSEQTYTIRSTDWDTKDNTYYLRYQPNYQKGIGMSIKVESEAPITYLGFGTRMETLQINNYN